MNDARRQRMVVVLGMHRSGTSAVMRGLMALGVSPGDNLMPPVPGNNERGFWEDMDVYALNESLLAGGGEAWDSLRLYDGRVPATGGFEASLAQGRALLARKREACPDFGFKDPRTSRLLFYWRRVFADLGLEPLYVIATRHPLSVAQSLRARDGLGTAQSCLLWLEHMAAALHWTADSARVVVDYDRLLENPAREVARVQAALQLPSPPDLPQRVAEFAEEFLSESLRHARHGQEELLNAESLPRHALRLHRLLERLARDDLPAQGAACLAEARDIWEAISDMAPVLSLAEQGLRDVKRLEAEAAARVQAQAELDQRLVHAAGALADAQRECDRLRGDMAALQANAAESARRRDHERALAAVTERELEETRARLDEQGARIYALQADQRTLNERLQAEIAAAEDAGGGLLASAGALWRALESGLLGRNLPLRCAPDALLRPGPARGQWLALGAQARFRLSLPGSGLPRGWVLVRGALRSAPDAGAPRLVLELGSGSSAAERSLPVRVLDGGRICHLVHLPDDLSSLYWSPVDRPGEFVQSPLRLSRVGALERWLRSRDGMAGPADA